MALSSRNGSQGVATPKLQTLAAPGSFTRNELSAVQYPPHSHHWHLGGLAVIKKGFTVGAACALVCFYTAGLLLASDAEGLIGKWKMEAQGRFFELELAADGKGTLVGQSLTYRVERNSLVIAYPSGVTESMTYLLEGDILKLMLAGSSQEMVFKRQGIVQPSPEQPSEPGAQPSQPAPQKPLKRVPKQPSRDAAKGPPIEIYVFKQDSSVKVGYPRGWTVSEHELGVSIAEKQTNDTAGIDLLIMAVQQEVRTKEDFAKMVVDLFHQSSYPDLVVVKQEPHPRASEVLTLDVTFTINNLPYQAHAWCMINPQAKIGVFATFYAPKERYRTFQGEKLLVACLIPMFGGVNPGQTAGLTASTISVSTNRQIIFIRKQGNNRILSALDPSTGQATSLYNYQTLAVCQPGLSPGGDVLILNVYAARKLFCHMGIKNLKTYFKESGKQICFPMEFSLEKQETHITHPTISRDGKVVAVRLKSLAHAGNVDVHDWSTGLYDHTFMAIASWFKVASFMLEQTVKGHAVYYKDEDMPDVMKDVRVLGPVFSPTQDILAYADTEKIYLCDSDSGEKLREFVMAKEYGILAFSGLAFSPDGTTLAYLSSAGYNKGGSMFGGIIYTVITVDIRNGGPRQYSLPEAVRPYSPAGGYGSGIACLDFSPDGRYIVFSGTSRDAGESWAVTEFEELTEMEKPSDIYILDLWTGTGHRLTSDGKSFDPVWKGR